MPLELQVAFSGTTCNNSYKKQENRLNIKIKIKMAGGEGGGRIFCNTVIIWLFGCQKYKYALEMHSAAFRKHRLNIINSTIII